MTAKRKPQNTWVLIVSGLAALALVVLVVMLNTIYEPVDGVIRVSAILGYLCVFVASLSSLYVRELTRFFGRTFVKVHHSVAVTGLASLAVHAIAVAWRSGTASVFLPRFDSLEVFFSLGGRPAFWLIAVASLTALLRATIGKRWRTIHWLNYLAFILGTVHALMIGPNFQHPVPRIVAAGMALGLVYAFVRKRGWLRKRA
ncbi:MAG: hypothetical protein JXB35_15130 [Anaerolineae bacterium]|nr:hypothetical protein [Anaerolineae bacterium]